jgi:hypothetical protein
MFFNKYNIKKIVKIFTVLLIIIGIFVSIQFIKNSSNEVNAACWSSCGCTCCASAGQCVDIDYCSPCDCSNSYTCPGNPPPPPPPGVPPPPPPPPAPPPPPPCSVSNPGIFSQINPVDNAANLDLPIYFNWSAVPSWGNGCPTSQNYYILYKLKATPGEVCTTTGWTQTGALGNVTAVNLAAGLQWGRNYCWWAHAYNGSRSRFAGPRSLSTNAVPTLISSGFTSTDVCGVGASGAAGQAGVTNPVTYSFTYEDADSNDQFQEVWLSFVPVTSVNTATSLVNVVQTAARNANAFSVKINVLNGQVSYVTTASAAYNQMGTYSAGVASGDVTISSGAPLLPRATILGVGTNTNAVVSGNRVTGTFQIRFENNFPANNFNVYGAALVRTRAGAGKFVTSGANGIYDYVYQRLNTWRVDTVRPTTTLTGPAVQANGTFNVTWASADNVGVTGVFPYVYSDVAGSRVRDNTRAVTVTTPGAPLTYPADAVNYTGIAMGLQGARNYSDLDPGNLARYSFRYYSRDAACNVSNPATVSTLSLAPWIMGVNGSSGGGEGIDRMNVPNIANFTVPFTAPAQTGPAFFTTYSALSGSTDAVGGNPSKFGYSAINYVDDAAIPDEKATSGGWYDYLIDLVKKNAKSPFGTVPTVSGSKTVGTRMSGASGINSLVNEKRNVEVQGSLIVNAGTICDVRAIIFVSGNLTLNPDLPVQAAPVAALPAQQTYNGCMYIVKGNVTIGTGTAKTIVANNNATQASYDIVNAFIITDGIFNAPEDNLGVGRKWDALYINGGVINKVPTGQKINLQRDLNLIANTIQPAMVVNYDPRYKITFLEDFASRTYSLREFGL